jgi:two-component system, chemotaxis family, chemotaxis protein CheY
MFIGKRSGEMNTRTTILTVDDSASMRQMISFTLKGAGYEVIEAVDGRDAIEKMEIYPVQMLITDINMPNLDGIELVRKVRMHAVYRFIPIILLTTESQDTKRQEGKAAGATGWIVKPFKPDQLLNVVRKVIG